MIWLQSLAANAFLLNRPLLHTLTQGIIITITFGWLTFSSFMWRAFVRQRKCSVFETLGLTNHLQLHFCHPIPLPTLIFLFRVQILPKCCQCNKCKVLCAGKLAAESESVTSIVAPGIGTSEHSRCIFVGKCRRVKVCLVAAALLSSPGKPVTVRSALAG